MNSTGEAAPMPRYRSAKPLPFELVQHVGIFFEEKLYTQALKLLTNILASGAVAETPTFIPSPHHLALATTFLVHPSTTSRTKTSEEEEAPNASLQLLRLTNSLVGPIAANFDAAFSFTRFESSRHGGRRREDDRPAENGAKSLNFDLAQTSSLWSRAEDFWHAVGWAFNCSVLHHDRWDRWQIWLEFMCEVLETDWNLRLAQQETDEQQTGPTSTLASPRKNKKRRAESELLKESLIYRFISAGAGGYGQHRRILRAIFADGAASSTTEFREVFHNELKQVQRDKQNVKKREVEVNIDEEEFGDYLTDDDDDSVSGLDTTADSHETSSSTATPTTDASSKRPIRQSKRPRRGTRVKHPDTITNNKLPTSPFSPTTTTTPKNPLSEITLLGDITALALRKRLLHILSGVSEHLPRAFMPIEDLYHLFTENIRHLPFPIFQSFVNPRTAPYFSPAAQTTLCESLLYRMRESAAPDSEDVYINQRKLETCFLPFAASTPSLVDNAKVSITLEALLMLLAESDMLIGTEELKEAVMAGILARADKVQIESKRGLAGRRKLEVEWCWLLESGERLRFLVNELVDVK